MKYIHDITHCVNEKCKKKKKCYRYNAAKELTDGFYSFFIGNEENCEYFMKDDVKTKNKKLWDSEHTTGK